MVARSLLICALGAASTSAYVFPGGSPVSRFALRSTTLEREETSSAVDVAGEVAAAERLVVAPAIEAAVSSLLDESCDAVEEPEPECLDPARMAETRGLLSRLMRTAVLDVDCPDPVEEPTLGDALEEGWERRGKSSSIRRNVEVWRSLAGCAFKVLKARKKGPDSAGTFDLETCAAHGFGATGGGAAAAALADWSSTFDADVAAVRGKVAAAKADLAAGAVLVNLQSDDAFDAENRARLVAAAVDVRARAARSMFLLAALMLRLLGRVRRKARKTRGFGARRALRPGDARFPPREPRALPHAAAVHAVVPRTPGRGRFIREGVRASRFVRAAAPFARSLWAHQVVLPAGESHARDDP